MDTIGKDRDLSNALTIGDSGGNISGENQARLNNGSHDWSVIISRVYDGLDVCITWEFLLLCIHEHVVAVSFIFLRWVFFNKEISRYKGEVSIRGLKTSNDPVLFARGYIWDVGDLSFLSICHHQAD